MTVWKDIVLGRRQQLADLGMSFAVLVMFTFPDLPGMFEKASLMSQRRVFTGDLWLQCSACVSRGFTFLGVIILSGLQRQCVTTKLVVAKVQKSLQGRP